MDCSVNSLLQFSAGICTANAAYPGRQKCPYRKVGQRIDLLYPQEQPACKPGRLLHCPKVGSIQEEADQRGLAHFLEHMCFNGTTHFPGDALKQYLERIGVKFGENLNAYTSVDETVYNISNVPVTTPGAIDSCLLILHDWSNDLTLDPKEIDKERGVINEEWRTRMSAIQRFQEKMLPVMFEGTKYATCFPIGTMEVVMNFKPQTLRDYYESGTVRTFRVLW